METYKMGNRVTAIIRAWCAGQIGDYTLTYKNEPFLILPEVEVRLGYKNKVSEANAAQNTLLSYNADAISEVSISNIPISDKILSLIYSKNEEKLCNVVENCFSDEENKVYLSSPQTTIYQVFIFSEGHMIQAYGELDITEGITLPNSNTSYTICYSYEGQVSVCLDRPENYYVTIDFEITGNVGNTTSHMWIHLDKCNPIATKQLNFGDKTNTINLNFRVINDNFTNNYITLK